MTEHVPQPTMQEAGAPARKRSNLPRLLAILFAVGISLAIFLFRGQLSHLARFGLPGVLLVSFLGNATLILPAPSLALVFAMGSVLPAWQVGLVAGVGEALGEMTGYLAGYAGSAVVEDRQRYEKIHAYVQKYGVAPIVVLSIIPNPFFDLAGLAAGMLKMPVWKFLLACWLGKTIKTLAFAYAGSGSAELLAPWLQKIF